MFKKIVNKIKGKKEEDQIDVTNLSLRDLRKGYIIDYFMQSWEVKEAYQYDWGNNFFSKEYLITNGKEKKYLHVEDDGELILSLTEDANILSIDKSLKSDIIAHDKPSSTINYKGKIFYMDEESQGYFRDMDNDYWSEFVSWDFVDEEKKELIGLTRWGESEIEASVGIFVEEYEFSNIVPA
ncbi:MAG: DUF4178 domain-containing protein [Bacteroidetes bacterium]|jgi:hypothetical protein|nr:DUF4178 domain-containing protein [Bacteroidota bacterium]